MNEKEIINGEKFIMENLDLDNPGMVKVFGYKTFRGLIKVLKRANESGIKHKAKMKFTITLPVKR